MDERKRRMIHWYDRIARAFDCHPMPLSTRLAEALVRQAAISEGEWVLDVGTGTGNVALAAARCVGARGRVVGVDLSRAMLREARRRAGDLPIEFQEMDAEALHFGDATFHAALGGLLPEVVPVISEMHRVLRPGGRAAFSSYTPETFQPLADVTWSRLERHRIRVPPLHRSLGRHQEHLCSLCCSWRRRVSRRHGWCRSRIPTRYRVQRIGGHTCEDPRDGGHCSISSRPRPSRI